MTLKNKIITSLVSLSLFVVILAISAWAINRYVYDLVHYLPMAGSYQEKSISVIDRVYDSEGDVGEMVDFEKLKNDLKDNINYSIKYFLSYQLLIKRDFDGKEYRIRFTNSNTRKTSSFMVNSIDPCTEPDYSIEQRANKMIDGLPITETQKNNIKNNIEVRGISTRHWGS